MKRIIAVYDVDPFYADRFAEFVNRKETVPFTAVAFTSIGRLKQFAEQQEVELLLAGDEVETEELKDIRAGQVIRLGETNAAREGGRSVYKYQASDSVLREVMACYQSQEPGAAFFPAAGKRSQVIGVYSPVGRCGKTAFAFTLAQVLAREGRALFLTLEEFSGLSGLTGTEFQNGLSDLLYYYRQGLYSHLRLGSMVYSWGDLDYVPPVAYPEDLEQVTGAEMAGLVEKIAGEGAYGTVVVDLGNFFWGAEMVLAICDGIFVPVKEDMISEGKLDAWRQYLERSGRGRLWQRTRMIKVPEEAMACTRETYLEQLLWSRTGDFARGQAGFSQEYGPGASQESAQDLGHGPLWGTGLERAPWEGTL